MKKLLQGVAVAAGLTSPSFAESYINEGDSFISGVRSVVEDIERYASETPNCNENYQPTDFNASRCELETYTVQKTLTSYPEDSSKGQRILIIDTGMAVSAVRYPKRILNMYQWKLDWKGSRPVLNYEESTATATMRKGLYHVKHEILGSSRNFVPSTELTRQLDFDLMGRLTSDMTSEDVHGDISLNVLADYNPDVQFVLLDLFSFDNADIICSVENIESVENSIKKSVSTIADEFGINYIHLSSGVTKAYIEKIYDKNCENSDWNKRYVSVKQMQKSYTNILKSFAYNATLFQAAVGSSQSTLEKAYDWSYWNPYYSDCINISNRLRSGFLAKNQDGSFNIPDKGMPYEKAKEYLSTGQQRNHECNDIYINVGWNENFSDFPSFGNHPVLFSSDGLGAAPMGFMATSFINPVALSFVNSSVNGNANYSKMVVDSISDDAANDDPFLIDPMYEKSFMLCGKFPAACKNWETFKYGN